MKKILFFHFKWSTAGVVFLVSGLYFLASLIWKGSDFYIFDALWRVGIIAGLLLLGFRPHLSPKQWVSLIVLFTLEFFLYRFFQSSLPIYRILISVCFAPMAEEFLFRGWIIQKVEGSNKQKIIASSFFFSLYHLKNAFVLSPLALIYQILYAGLVVGPLFAWVRIHYGSVFTSIVLHSGNNTIADVITPKLLPFLVKRTKDFS